VDLITWIRQEHDGLAARLHDWFVVDVPLDRWLERPGGWVPRWPGSRFMRRYQDVTVNVAARRCQWRRRTGRLYLGAAMAAGLDERPPRVASGRRRARDHRLSGCGQRRHGHWLAAIDAAALDVVPPASQRLTDAGFTDAGIAWVHARWSDKPVSWFVQWEAIGHGLLHHGEMAALRARLGSH
jgi:hypothetical protein